MDAFFQGVMKQIQGKSNSKSTPVMLVAEEKLHSEQLPVFSYDHQQRTDNSMPHSDRKQQQQHHRIAQWDKKREKCKNCQLIYLKTLSHTPGFCSVDCKSNAMYLDKVNKTIRAVKNAVNQLQQQESSEEVTVKQQEVVKATATATVRNEQAPVAPSTSSTAIAITSRQRDSIVHAHTFSEFDLEARIMDESNVEWAFSAMY